MAPIKEFSTADLNTISRINTVSNTIEKINGVTVTTPAVGTPAAAYSVRLLGSAVGVSSYTGDCMRVRRASDNVEADIAFDAGELKLTSGVSNTSDALSYTDFADFVDHTGTPTSAYVRWWYDQSGNANDAGQSTAPSQPQIYDATTGLIEEGSVGNEKPALDFDGSDDELVKTAVNFGSTLTFTTVVRERSVGGIDPIFGDDVRFYNSHSPTFGGYTLLFAGTVATASGNGGAVQNLYFGTVDSGTGNVWRNGSQQITSASVGSNTITDLTIGDDTTVQQGDIIMQELIFWESNQTSPTDNRTGIESDINTYFSIY